jgi:diguanylate cyclase (GGDEF)-like protein/PAS domain S-box-containing protein
MKPPLRILHLEDNPNDVLLIRKAIIAHGIDVEIVNAATRADFVAALEKGTYDMVLADYTLPSFDGLSALSLVREKFPDLPFIFVTGTMGEEKAVETLKKGATDYVLKHNLARLVPSIMRALREAEERAQRKQTQKALKESEERYRFLFNGIRDAVYVHEVSVEKPGKFIAVNNSACSMLGYTMDEFLQMEVKDIDTPEQSEKIPSIHEKFFRDGYALFETCHVAKDGRRIPVEINIKLFELQGKSMVLSVARDISERKKAEDRIEYLAYYDSLTGLPNRNLFLETINKQIAEAKNSSNSLAVVMTDINKFKSIYDIYGSEVGDRVLKEVAERLSTAIRKGDIAAHLGNDEFGIACIGLTGSDDIIMLEKIIKDISYPLKIHGDEIILAFSTGISLYPHDGENASELLKSAGLALSTAKKEGGKTCQFYSKDMIVMATERMLLEKQLMEAIKNEEFILHYQPYWEITTKKMVGMEALVRWQSKDKGLIPPGKFIPVLEDTGMIIEVGEWILREAMRQVKEWQNNGYPVVPVSVNMSLVQFRQKDLAGMVKKIMKDCGYYPSLLTLEITESAFMQDIEFTRSVLTAMKEIGCSVSIDDFGTGYSSLAYLKRFPVDNLKIDISFIREMVKDPDSASIVVAIINMAHTLNLKTIAEGIETEEQWNFLRLLRCDMGQGFYLSKPLPAEDVEKLFIH